MSLALMNLLFEASLATIAMIFGACAIALLFGLPLGVLLYVTRCDRIWPNMLAHRVMITLVNTVRSIPFIILMFLLTPLTRWIVGSSIGTAAATVPLAIAAIPFLARLIESSLHTVDKGLLEAAQAMGASPLQIVGYVLLPESIPSIVRAVTITLITLVGYSAMAGTVGGGGLGDIAIRYGYQRFEWLVMLITVLILILLVHVLQFLGDGLSRYLSHHQSSPKKG